MRIRNGTVRVRAGRLALTLIVGTAIPCVGWAAGEQSETETQPAATTTGSEARPAADQTGAAQSNAETGELEEPGSVQARIDKLTANARRAEKVSLQMLVGSRGLQARRPKVARDDDPAKHAAAQKAVRAWVTQVDSWRKQIEAHLDRVETLRVRLRKLRRVDMTDDQADALVKIEPGIENAWRALDRGVRELDVAWRRGVNDLDDPPKK
jgi:hypothetical protein